MADMQRSSLTGKASMRIPILGSVQVGGKIMKELRFMPYSEFPEVGREETLYIDTDSNVLYYYDGTVYVALSGGGGGGTGDYNELYNKPQINGNVLTGNKTASNLGLQETISDIDTIRSGAASGSTAVQPATLATALATKQDVISDLASIRTGASKGDTAVQPSDMESALSEKQDTISDLQTIRSGAALGATAIQPADMETALADKQDVISDLDAIRSGATAGYTALQPEDIDTLPTDGSSNPVSSGGTYAFVNSSISTNTAYFIGTFASVEELEAYTGTVTNNDYAFVTSTDSAGNTLYNRYKYNATTQTWGFEYAVNNTAFTAAQWAAIQSGMTSADKTKLDGIETGANKTVIDTSPTSGSSNAVSSGGVHTALSGKQDTIADLSDIRSGASAGATAVQPSALNDYQTKLSGTNKLDPSYIDYDASHRAVSDTEKTTWNGKQDAISDLSTIRSGAAAGATALQQSDVTSTYSASGTAPVNGTAVNAAIETLDVSSVGGSGKYISAISETNGKIEATPTTFDTALSSSSTNNNAPTSKTVFDDQQRQEVEIGAVANSGAKSLLPIGVSSITYYSAVTFSVADDGQITVNGTNPNTSNGIAYQDIVTAKTQQTETRYTLPVGRYKITGTGTDGLRFQVHCHDGTNTHELFSKSSSGEFNYTESLKSQYPYICWRILIVANSSFSNHVVKPMIWDASITDPTFQPYALSNPTLTPAAIKAVDEGSKNKLSITIQSQTVRTVPFTVNSDGSITANGTVTGGDAYLNLETSIGNKYVGMMLSGGTASLKICISKGGSGQIAVYSESSEGVAIPDNATNTLFLFAPNGTVLSNVTVKPMICTAADWAISQKYVPYALTNPTLTPALIEQVDNGAKNHLYCDINVMHLANTNGTWSGNAFTHNSGVTFTINSDSSITVNGTASDVNGVFVLSTDFTISQGDWILSGTPTGGSSSTYNTTIAGVISDIGNTARFSSATNKLVRIYVVAGTTVNNLLFKPMVCSTDDWAISQKFVPYAPTNRELYEMIKALQNNS